MDVSILPCLIFLIHLTHMHVVIIFVKPCKWCFILNLLLKFEYWYKIWKKV
jgi:hypothetical protein